LAFVKNRGIPDNGSQGKIRFGRAKIAVHEDSANEGVEIRFERAKIAVLHAQCSCPNCRVSNTQSRDFGGTPPKISISRPLNSHNATY
jgi:hypothetical protein